MPARVLVDSGAWIALLHRADQHHDSADRLFRLAVEKRTPLLTTNLILAEVQRLLLHRIGPRPAASFLQRVDASDLLHIEFATRSHHRSARDWLARLADQKITYTDAVSFAVMDAARCRAAMSFDNDFRIAGFQLWNG